MPATDDWRPAAQQRGAAAGDAPARRPFRDNPRLILAGIVVLLARARRLSRSRTAPPRFSPDFLTEVVLYALSVTNLMMLLALVFVLARNVIKLVVERRRGAAVRALPRQAGAVAARHDRSSRLSSCSSSAAASC